MIRLTSKELTICAIFAALTAILSQVSIPFASGVPFTLQTLVIQLLAIILGARLGVMTTLIYLLLGAIGLPVFAQMSGGVQILFGPTGGFLLSFPLMVYLLGLAIERTQQPLALFGVALAVTLINLLIGTAQFMIFSAVSFSEAMVACFWPFLFFGIIKAGIAVWFGLRLRRHVGIQVLTVA